MAKVINDPCILFRSMIAASEKMRIASKVYPAVHKENKFTNADEMTV